MLLIIMTVNFSWNGINVEKKIKKNEMPGKKISDRINRVL